MKTVALTCPHCNADIIPIDGLDTFYCVYCGTQIVLEGMSDAGYNAKVKIKEFALVEREMAQKERIRNKEIEQEERIRSREIQRDIKKGLLKFLRSDNAAFAIGITVSILLIVVGFSFMSISQFAENVKQNKEEKNLVAVEKEIEDAILAGDLDAAEIKVNQLRLDDGAEEDINKWDEKRDYYLQLLEKKKKENLLLDDYLPMPADCDYFDGIEYSTAASVFEDAGFKNIECKPSAEGKGFFTESGSVEHISAGGKIEFTTDDYGKADDPIIIYYYE